MNSDGSKLLIWPSPLLVAVGRRRLLSVLDEVSVVAELTDRLVMMIVPKEIPTSSVGAYSSCITTSCSGSDNSAVSSIEIRKSFSTSSKLCSLQSELSVVEKHDYGHLKRLI